MLMLVIEDAVQILSPANDADETVNDPTASLSLYGAATKARMTKDLNSIERFDVEDGALRRLTNVP